MLRDLGWLKRIKIQDGQGDNFFARVDSSGRLLTASNVIPPPDTTPVNVILSGNVAVTDDNFYIIPNGEELTVIRLSGGAEVDATAGSVIELFDAPNGTTVGAILLTAIYSSGNSQHEDVEEKLIGDGTRAILLRRRRLTGGSKEVFGRWEGYY